MDILSSPEFLAAMAALTRATVAGQPGGANSPVMMSANMLQEQAGGRAQQVAAEKAKKEAEKEEKGGKLGQIGSVLGGIAGSFIPIPGVGTALGAAIGSGLGSGVGNIAGRAVGGADVDFMDFAQPALIGGLTSFGTGAVSNYLGTQGAATAAEKMMPGPIGDVIKTANTQAVKPEMMTTLKNLSNAPMSSGMKLLTGLNGGMAASGMNRMQRDPYDPYSPYYPASSYLMR